jgi:hypothetical protein
VVATPPDRYGPFVVGFTLPETLMLTVELKAGERAIVPFRVKRPPTVSGQVVTADGRPVPGVPVEMLGRSSTVDDRAVLAPIRTVTSDAAGRFVMDRLKPGEFYLRALPPGQPGAPLNFVYAPGTTRPRDATPLRLEAGDEVTVGLTLRSVPAVRVSGRVVGANGDPAANIRVTLSALDRTTKPLSLPTTGPGSELGYAARTDEHGQFVFSSVFAGLYALRAVARRDDRTPIAAAGVAEVDVDASDTTDLVVALTAPARLTGRFMFNGAEDADPARTQVTMVPDGQHAHLLAGLATSDAWHADGRFEVDGVFGAQRLMLRSSGAWFVERATLEDGTEFSTAPYAFAAGRTYPNVRVWVSDKVATLSGPLPSWWDPHAGIGIVVFPDEAALRTPDSTLVRTATVSMDMMRFSVSGLPPGHSYLVAAVAVGSAGLPTWGSEELFALLTPIATRVVISEPQLYEVAVGPPLRW